MNNPEEPGQVVPFGDPVSAADPIQNESVTILEPDDTGKPVITGDVVPYAKRKCKTCFGKGEFISFPVGGGRRARLCGCGLKRFLAAHKGMLRVNRTSGQLSWRPLHELLPQTAPPAVEGAPEPAPEVAP